MHSNYDHIIMNLIYENVSILLCPPLLPLTLPSTTFLTTPPNGHSHSDLNPSLFPNPTKRLVILCVCVFPAYPENIL